LKYFLILIFPLFLFSCTKSVDNTTKIGPVDISVIADTSVKFFVQNTDIPILLDSMTLDLYSLTDDINFNYYVEKIKINPGTTLNQFSKSVLRYNIPQQTVNNSTFLLSILHKWSTRFQTNTYKINSSTTNGVVQNIYPLNYPNNIIVTNGILLPMLDVNVSPSNPVLVPSQNLDKLLITKKSMDASIGEKKVQLYAIKKNGTFTTPPVVKNFDGRLIPFSESNNYYYLYFYPMTTNSYNNDLYKNLLFYNNTDFTTIVGSYGFNFIYSNGSRVYITEYNKDSNGRIMMSNQNFIQSKDLF
jgi:hypothetical protein